MYNLYARFSGRVFVLSNVSFAAISSLVRKQGYRRISKTLYTSDYYQVDDVFEFQYLSEGDTPAAITRVELLPTNKEE